MRNNLVNNIIKAKLELTNSCIRTLPNPMRRQAEATKDAVLEALRTVTGEYLNEKENTKHTNKDSLQKVDID
ncbi:hypothetical protein [Desulfuribacillus alkaliarsenatis]|uniref:Uncharacterized protein n=1 Tax=Desulfuribacillus alkaliarsenatis TaxID=766136 RepID=A0A1E5G466_9FIRM|nr:hypothetical protein [Desulfuribacillus alkaliarsenatis]OEF97459.1 hypothetical protein BHF68_04435 [Desulfuribacillus alkaliarsenatis]